MDQDAPLKDLQARRQRIAPEALKGDPEALKALKAIDAEIKRATTAAELRAVAETEETRRAEQAQAEAKAEAEEARRTELAGLFVARIEAARRVEQDVETLLASIGRLLDVGRAMYAASAGLGHPRRRLLTRDQLAQFLAWRLSEVMETDPVMSFTSRSPLRPWTSTLES